MDPLTAPDFYKDGAVRIGDAEYQTKLFTIRGLLHIIRNQKPFASRLEKAIQTYRGHDEFRLGYLVLEYLDDEPDDAETLILVLSDPSKGDAIVSTCRLSYSLAKKSGYISLVYTSEEFRGKGICQHTIGHLLETTKHGLDHYNLLVDKANVAAIKCYEKNGFVITGDGEKDTHRMELDRSKAGGAGKRKTRKTRRRR
jgi:ribosomal protein S18 acetylase RimI-like enzyme